MPQVGLMMLGRGTGHETKKFTHTKCLVHNGKVWQKLYCDSLLSQTTMQRKAL